VVSAKEAADGQVPAADEIQVVMVEDSATGPDSETLGLLFNEGNVQWYAPTVAAAVLVKEMNANETDEGKKAKNVDQVLQGIGVLPFAGEYAGLRAQLLGTPAPEETPPADESTPEEEAQ